MTRLSIFLRVFIVSIFLPVVAFAQQTVWVQVEAQPTLAQAEARARAYSNVFPNVSGFRMRSGWYALALGPYSRAVADSELRALRSRRLIPGDSFIAFSNAYRTQFWPVGASTLNAAPSAPNADVVAEPIQPEAAEAAPATPLDETPREARTSERLLTRDERRALQEALQWEGFYTSAIDGAFGPGTRRAMSDYQASKGLEPTGVLTTRQRRDLIEGYRKIFAELGLELRRDTEAGIEILMPTAQIKRQKVEPPFVQFDASTSKGMQMLLISQEGDQDTLFGLYDIMQTLEIVPLDGERQRGPRSFTLTGQSGTLQSYTFAQLTGGAVKGFTLVWKPEDARVMDRVIKDIKASFTALPDAVLPDIAGDGSAQRIDLVSGLQIRRPTKSRSGYYISDDGRVLTTTEVLGSCERLTLAEDFEADVVAQNAELGLAVLAPRTPLAPVAVAAFQARVPRLQSEVALAGYSFGDVLDLPSVSFGTLADIRGLNGENDVQRLEVSALPGDVGGPVLDQTGAVLGSLLARPTSGRQLPENVHFVRSVPTIAEFLSNAGISALAAPDGSAMPAEDFALRASDMTVLVSCWN